MSDKIDKLYRKLLYYAVRKKDTGSVDVIISLFYTDRDILLKMGLAETWLIGGSFK